MIVEKSIVKNWFKKFSKPTEIQFHSFFDSILWKGEQIPVNQIESLNSILINKADKEQVDALLQNIAMTAKPYDLTNSPSFLNYKYFGVDVYGVLLAIPTFQNDTYIFTHDLGVLKYLRVEVWEDGLPMSDPKMKAREDLTQLVYGDPEGIGQAKVSKTKIGADHSGSIQLKENSIEVSGSYRFPGNKLLYVEFTKDNNSDQIIISPPRGGGDGVIQR